MELAIINGTYRDSQSKHSSPGLDSARFLASNQNAAALQNMVNQQNAAALRTVAAAAGAPLGGAPLILSHHRLQLQPPTSAAAPGLINGTALAGQTQPPPLIAPGDSSLLYAQYANAMAANADYAAAANYSGLVSPLLAAEYSTDPSGGTAAGCSAGGGKDRRQLNGGQSVRSHPYPRN